MVASFARGHKDRGQRGEEPSILIPGPGLFNGVDTHDPTSQRSRRAWLDIQRDSRLTHMLFERTRPMRVSCASFVTRLRFLRSVHFYPLMRTRRFRRFGYATPRLRSRALASSIRFLRGTLPETLHAYLLLRGYVARSGRGRMIYPRFPLIEHLFHGAG